MGGTLGLAALALILASVRVTAAAAAALVIGSVAWILVLSTLSSQYQSTLPGWAKARGMAYYLLWERASGEAAEGIRTLDLLHGNQ